MTRFSLLPAVLLLACTAPTPPLDRPPVAGPAPWSDQAVVDAPDAFRFLVVSDRTGGHRHGVFSGAIDKINLLQPAFVVSVGDLIEGYTEDPAELEAQWREFDGFVERLDMPFFYAAGNHDFSNESMSRDWRARRGPSFYHFRYRGALFLVLNSEIFPGVAGEEGIPGPDRQADQKAYARDVLERNRDARHTFVLLHRPLWDGRRVHPDWLEIESWLGDRPFTVFAGHLHRYTSQTRHDRRFVTLASTGGGSRLRGIERGEFDHVVQVTVGDGEPVIANLMLDGIHGVDLRTLDTRERVDRLDRAIRPETWRSDAPVFERGTARFQVSNQSEEPLRVRARLHAGRDLVPERHVIERLLPPGAQEAFEVGVRARRPGPPGALAPARVEWDLVGRRADGTPLLVEETSWLLPEAVFDCPPASDTRVDGSLDEWRSLPFVLDGRPARDDALADAPASLRFGVAWDASFLYFAARVNDPTPASDASRIAREQDAVQVTLDARPAPARDTDADIFRARGQGWLRELAFAWLPPGESRPDSLYELLLSPLPPGTLHAARTTAEGYDVELAIPRAFLDERQGGPWQAFRLNVALQDFREPGADSATHWWRPSRFGLSDATPVPGAGTFERRDPAR